MKGQFCEWFNKNLVKIQFGSEFRILIAHFYLLTFSWLGSLWKTLPWISFLPFNFFMIRFLMKNSSLNFLILENSSFPLGLEENKNIYPCLWWLIHNLKTYKKLVSKKGHLAILTFLLTIPLNELKNDWWLHFQVFLIIFSWF